MKERRQEIVKRLVDKLECIMMNHVIQFKNFLRKKIGVAGEEKD